MDSYGSLGIKLLLALKILAKKSNLYLLDWNPLLASKSLLNSFLQEKNITLPLLSLANLTASDATLILR